MTKIKQTLENDRSRPKLLETSIEPTAYKSLTTIPLMEHDSYLDKTFWDTIPIRYYIPLKYLPSRRVCGRIFNLESRICPFLSRGLITLNHNELRYFKANQLSEVCHDVQLELQLKTRGEIYHYSTSNTTEDGRVYASV